MRGEWIQRWQREAKLLHRSEPGCPTVQVLVSDLKACGKSRNLWMGKQLHAEAVQCGLSSDIYVANTLISMYSRCGSMAEAHRVFDSVKHPQVVSWNALIVGYAENGQGAVALDLLMKMEARWFSPNSITLLAALKACTSLLKGGGDGLVECREHGKEIHNIAKESRDSNVKVHNALIDMYSKCGSMADARQVFDGLQHPTVVSWNAMILGYAENGQGHTALDLFTKMKSGGPAPDSVTFLAVLKACSCLSDFGDQTKCRQWSKAIHEHAVVTGCDSDYYVQNALIAMYAKFGSLVDAPQLFDRLENPDVVSWNAVILGYADNGQSLASRLCTQSCNLLGCAQSLQCSCSESRT